MTSPNINISIQNVVGNCDLKCSYNFKYSESNSTATNSGILISLTYDATSTPPVVYNTQQYTVGNITITSPSIHTFNNNILSGEIIITHNPVKGGNQLDVCIPFITSTMSTSASNIITEIIQTVATNAPSSGDSTNLNISGFNLQNIIPKKPFFTYTQGTTDYIIFGELESIPLSSSTITTLQQIIAPYAISTPGSELFYNSKGPVSGIDIGDGLYISCQPTGSSVEETEVEYDKTPTTSVDFSNILNNPTFQTIMFILIGCIFFVAIFYGLSTFYNFISSGAVKTIASINS